MAKLDNKKAEIKLLKAEIEKLYTKQAERQNAENFQYNKIEEKIRKLHKKMYETHGLEDRLTHA